MAVAIGSALFPLYLGVAPQHYKMRLSAGSSGEFSKGRSVCIASTVNLSYLIGPTPARLLLLRFSTPIFLSLQ